MGSTAHSLGCSFPPPVSAFAAGEAYGEGRERLSDGLWVFTLKWHVVSQGWQNPLLCAEAAGSWQHTHQAHIVNGCYRQCSRAPGSACFWSSYSTNVDAKLSNLYLQKLNEENWMKESWKKDRKLPVGRDTTKGTKSYEYWGNKDTPIIPLDLRALPLLVLSPPCCMWELLCAQRRHQGKKPALHKHQHTLARLMCLLVKIGKNEQKSL